MRELAMASTSAKVFLLLSLWLANHVYSLPYHKSVREDRAVAAGITTEEEIDVSFLNRAFLLSRDDAFGFVRSPKGIRRIGSDLTTVTATLSTSQEDVHPEGMVLSEDERKLIVLWTNGSSFAYDSTTLAPVRQLWRGFGHYVAQPTGVHGAPLQVVFNGEGDDSVYIASSTEYVDVGQVAVSSGGTLRKESETIDKNDFWRELKYGFTHGGYSYMVSSDCNALFEVRIARFCNDPSTKAFNSWYELQLTCGERTSATAFNHFLVNATLLKTPPTSPDTSPLLVISVGVYQTPEIRVCSYSLADINRQMDDTFNTCKSTNGQRFSPVWEPNWGRSGYCDKTQGITPCSLSKETVFGVEGPMQLASRHPLNQDPPLLTLHGETPSTTAATFKGNDSVAIFVGTRNGSVREYKAGAADIQQEWILSTDTAVVHLAVSEDGSVLYALLNNTVPMVHSVPLNNYTHPITELLPPPNFKGVNSPAAADKVSLTESLQELKGLRMHWRIRKFLSRLVHLLHEYGRDEQFNSSTELTHKGGVWRVTFSMFQATQNESSLKLKARIQRQFKITWSAVTYADLDDPLHSSLAVVLYLQALENRVLRGPAKQAEIWAAHFAAEVFGEECHECAAKKFLCVLCEVDDVCVKGVNDCQ